MEHLPKNMKWKNPLLVEPWTMVVLSPWPNCYHLSSTHNITLYCLLKGKLSDLASSYCHDICFLPHQLHCQFVSHNYVPIVSVFLPQFEISELAVLSDKYISCINPCEGWKISFQRAFCYFILMLFASPAKLRNVTL